MIYFLNIFSEYNLEMDLLISFRLSRGISQSALALSSLVCFVLIWKISLYFLPFYYLLVIFTCVAEGERRSRSAVTPSVCPSIFPSVRPKILSSQLLWNYWSNYHETWYVDRTYVVMHIGRKFWSPHFCGSYAPWNLENTHKWPCNRNSSETTDPIFMKLGM